VGREGSLRFWGSSFVADPRGQLLALADDASEQVLVVDCDLTRIESQRRDWPFLRDRRIDAYGDLLARFRR
jgi:N-carbamoylputrescine amidase